MGRVQVLLLGRFAVSVDERPVPAAAWRQRRARDLVKLLALAPGHRLHREQVIEALWAELPPAAGAANLHKAAHYARAALGARNAIVLRAEQVRLWPGASVEVDADRFAAAAEAALQTGDADGCARAAEAYAGELLPEDRYEQWVQEPRARLRLLHLELLRRAESWERLAAEEPTDEPAHQALMRRHLAAGNTRAALSQFHVLRATLARELGVAPSPESLELYQQIARAPLRSSPVRYVRREGVSIAYQVWAGGPSDLLLIPGWISHLALDWEEPRWLEWCERVTSFARLIRFDKRGTGLSDRPPAGASPATAAQLYLACASSDVRPLLGRLRVPTLVLHRRRDRANPVEAGRDLAARISGARFVEVDGEDHLLWAGQPQALCRAIERFVTAHDRSRSLEPGKVLGRSAS